MNYLLWINRFSSSGDCRGGGIYDHTFTFMSRYGTLGGTGDLNEAHGIVVGLYETGDGVMYNLPVSELHKIRTNPKRKVIALVWKFKNTLRKFFKKFVKSN